MPIRRGEKAEEESNLKSKVEKMKWNRWTKCSQQKGTSQVQKKEIWREQQWK
jgi:hypothetical protein